jgi:hypothetical protein
VAEAEIKITAQNAEEAARLALGEVLTRGGHRTQLRAKVYTTDTNNGALTLVRLYAMSEGRHNR